MQIFICKILHFGLLLVLAGLCQSLHLPINTENGDLLHAQHARATTSFTNPDPTLTIVPTGIATSNSYCSWVSYTLSFCNSATPGFSTLSYTAQASCLCYSSTIWNPTAFDDSASSCLGYVSTAEPEVWTELASLEGFCTRSGTPTGTTLSSIAASSSTFEVGAPGTTLEVGAPSTSLGGGAPSTALATTAQSATPTTAQSAPPTSVVSLPTPTITSGSNPPGPLQNFTPPQKGGLFAALGIVIILAGLGLYSRYCYKRK